MIFSGKKAKSLAKRVTANRISESFRTLTTNIEFVTIQKELKTIVFTSSNRDEGKSTIVSNYAITLASQGKRTLIIDCDLRNPTQHEIFNLHNHYGLTEILLSRISFEEAIKGTPVNNLWVITPGLMPPNPMAIINSDKMSQLIEDLKEQFDVIILDTCPISVASDPAILSAKADGTVLVVRAKQTTRDSLKRSIKTLELAQANLLGIVLNGIEHNQHDDYYYYGY